MWNTVFVVSVVILSLFSVKAVRFEGDKCILKYTREKGVCTPLSACESAKQALKTNVHPQTCSFNNQMPIVCCSKSPLSINTTSRNDEFSNCAPLPSRAIGQGVKRTGQKAWNKCIDLAEEVFKCSIAQSNDFDGPSRKSPEIRLTGKSGFDRFKRQISPPAVLSLEMDLGPDTTPKSNTIDRINLCLKDKKPDRVIGGNPASMGEFPHMALLGFGETGNVSEVNWSCGGTLISDRWVMTAGHCLYARSSGYVNFVVLGSENLETTPKTYYKVVNRVLHPDYSASYVYNDIALLQLDRKVEFMSTVRPACLHTGQSVKGREFIATGWGTTTYRGEQSKQLLKVDLNLFSEGECKAKYPVSRKLKDGVRYNSQMCVGHKTEKKDTCQGDSGGPLQTSNDEMIHCTYLVIGIVSAGMGCGVPGQPSLYTRVSAFIPWIESIVWP